MLADRLLALMLIGLAVATVASMLESLHWFAALFAHFRLHYLLAGVLIVCAFVYRRRFASALLTGVLLLPHLWFAGPYLLPSLGEARAADASGIPVTLMSLNLGFQNRDSASVRALIDELAPDVLVLSEWTPAWQRDLKPLESEYPWRGGESRDSPFGLTVFSRLPLEDVIITDLDAPGTVAVSADVRTAGDVFRLLAVHLFPPMSADLAELQRRQVAALVNLVRAERRSVVIGDLNLTAWSAGFRALVSGAGLIDRSLGSGPRYTWPAGFWPLALAIDHCLVTEEIQATATTVRRAVGSDHYPVICRLYDVGRNAIGDGPV